MKLNKFIIIVILLIGCSPIKHPIKSSEVVGKYIANYHNASDELVLFVSGEYLHSYYIDGELILDRNSWELLDVDSSNEEVGLRLFNFNFRVGSNDLMPSSDWIVSAEKSQRISLSANANNDLRVRLCFNYDLDHCFIQQP